MAGEARLLIFAGQVAIGTLFLGRRYYRFRVSVVGNRFRAGPWNLGRYSRPIDYAAFAFVVVILPILCFPATSPSFPETSDFGLGWLICRGV